MNCFGTIKDDVMEEMYGFNNITKSLNINIYNFHYENCNYKRVQYLKMMNSKFSASKLASVLESVVETIGANVLNVSKHNYEPLGASTTILLSEEDDIQANEHLVYHLDASHITAHTYPEFHPMKDVCSFRVDIEVSTCGNITPLKALDFLLDFFPHDLVSIDFRYRGFTRSIDGTKIYKDDLMTSICDAIPKVKLLNYALEEENISHFDSYHLRLMKIDENRHTCMNKEITEVLKRC